MAKRAHAVSLYRTRTSVEWLARAKQGRSIGFADSSSSTWDSHRSNSKVAVVCVLAWSGHQGIPLQLQMETMTLSGRLTSRSRTRWLKEHAKSGHSRGNSLVVDTCGHA